MSLILTIILIIGVWYLIRMFLAVNRARNQARDFFNQFGNASGRERTREREAGWSAPAARKRKKIDPEIGEYVAYEDVPADSSHNRRTAAENPLNASAHRENHEPQVTDVEWEDLPR